MNISVIHNMVSEKATIHSPPNLPNHVALDLPDHVAPV
jgi:hypothetical protein